MPIFILLGTFLPLIGVAVTILVAVFTSGLARWLVLFFVPFVTLILVLVFGGYIGENGNILFVLLSGIYLIALFVYYPTLIIVGLAYWIRSKKELKLKGTREDGL